MCVVCGQFDGNVGEVLHTEKGPDTDQMVGME